MLIDVNTYIGHYPFRATRNNTAREMVALMDRYNIAKACVSSISGVYYRDVMQGNYELLEEIKPYSGRFIPVCNINPTYANAKNDFYKCIKELGFKAVKLFPRQHNYALDCPAAIEILNIATEHNIPVQLPIYIEDLRQRHTMDIMNHITPEEILAALELAPKTTFIISNINQAVYAEVLHSPNYRHSGNIYYDTGRMDCLAKDTFAQAIERAGIEHILFGTGAPLQYIDVQLVKLAFLPDTSGITEKQMELIKSQNAVKLFG